MSPNRPLTMKTLERRVQALERERNLYRSGIVLLVIAAIGSFAGVFAVVKNIQQTEDIKDAVAQIQRNRVVLTAQGCRQRNNDRQVARESLRQELADIKRIPEAQLLAFGFTREEALQRKREQIAKVAPLNCKKLVKQVRSTKPISSPGGGSGSQTGARRPPAEIPSKRRERSGGTPGAPGPVSPPEPGPKGQEPPPGGGQPPDNGGPGNGGGSPQPVTPPEPQTPGPVRSIVDQIGQTVNDVLQQLP